MGIKDYIKRIIKWTFIMIFRVLRFMMFKYTPDSKYIKTLKGTHEGERCFVLGNGPSLTIEDLERLKGEFTFASNRIYKLFDKTSWRPSIYMSVDNDVIRAEHKEMEKLDLPCMLMNVTSKAYAKFDEKFHFFNMFGPYVIRQYRYKKKKIGTDPSRSFSMSYSILCLQIELAIYMGFKKIYILGCDHNYSHYVDEKGKYVINNEVVDYGYGIKRLNFTMQFKDATTSCFQAYKRFADANDIEIIDLTNNGKLDVFEKNTLDNILKEGK